MKKKRKEETKGGMNKQERKNKNKWKEQRNKKTEQTNKQRKDRHQQTIQFGFMWTQRWYTIYQTKCENSLRVSGTQGYRAWEGLHHPPLLPSGSTSASLWGLWEDSGAWHESTGPPVWDIQCCEHFIFLSHTQTLWKRLCPMAWARQTATSISLDAHPLHPKLTGHESSSKSLFRETFCHVCQGGTQRTDPQTRKTQAWRARWGKDLWLVISISLRKFPCNGLRQITWTGTTRLSKTDPTSRVHQIPELEHAKSGLEQKDHALVKPKKKGQWRVNASHGYPSVSKAFPIAPLSKKKTKKTQRMQRVKAAGRGALQSLVIWHCEELVWINFNSPFCFQVHGESAWASGFH